MDSETFSQQLAETITWCKPRVDIAEPKWCLRSDALKPDCDYHSPNDPTLSNDATAIRFVVQRRHNAIAQLGKTTLSPNLHGGRLLLCYFDETNHNEGSADESRWYYDGNDNPPWDTWVACLNDVLISWVPPQFLAPAADGMAVECCQMLMWLEQPVSYMLDDRPRHIPDWLKQYAWAGPSAKDAR